MAYMASGTLGAAAVILALGAVHIDGAAGNDGLGSAQRGDVSVAMPVRNSDDTIVTNVDRSAKGDRDTSVRPAGGLTLSFKLPSLPETSVMMRVPAGESADAVRKVPATTGAGKGSSDRSSAGPRPVACEPVVSVLTAVARQLAPGRCIT
jgi:hypothetical protein